eukprot:235962-Pleurochrysis_carterae.AAC.3
MSELPSSFARVCKGAKVASGEGGARETRVSSTEADAMTVEPAQRGLSAALCLCKPAVSGCCAR